MASVLTETIIKSSPSPIAVLVLRLASQLNQRVSPVAAISRYPKRTRNVMRDSGV